MSTLKVNAISDAAGANGNAITLASDGTCTAKITNSLSNRRLTLNGDMSVSQRGEVTGLQSGYGGADRYIISGNTAARVTLNQTTGTALNGFPSCQEVDVTTADASLAAGDYHYLGYRFEGQDLQQLKKGTANAESITLTFWVSSPKTGTHIIQLYDNDNSRHICKSYTVSTADTWEKKTLTFAGDTTGAFGNDNAYSLQIYWWLLAGSNYSSGTLATSWASFTGANGAVGQVNCLDNTANNFKLTGVQLEVGDTATEFEHRSYADELQRCKRYFNMFANPASETYSDDKGRQTLFSGMVWNKDTKDCRFSGSFDVAMRAAPSLYKVVGTSYFRIMVVGGANTTSDWTLLGSWTNCFDIKCTAVDSFGSDDNGMAIYALCFNSAARFGWDAEL